MLNKLVAGVLLVGLGGAADLAVAQQQQPPGPNPNALVAQRKAAMQLQGKYFGPIGAMVQGRVAYDPKIVQRNADYLVVLTQMAWDGFDPVTATAQNTRAKPEIYKDTAKFKAESDKLQAEVSKLAAAAKSNDQNAVKAAFAGVGASCNSCHDAFRTAQ